MIDLHTHILHGIDDGAKTIEDSLAILRAEHKSGVHTVALTPHYHLRTAEQIGFFHKRRLAYEKLSAAVTEAAIPVRLILGAEVQYFAGLINLSDTELDDFCYAGTKTMLLELPMYNYPSFVREVVYRLSLRGYKILLAHAERYPYFKKNPELLSNLVDGGALVQVSANVLLRGRWGRRRVLRGISEGMVHAIATDTHGIYNWPPRLDKAIAVVAKKLGEDTARRLVNFEWMTNI